MGYWSQQARSKASLLPQRSLMPSSQNPPEVAAPIANLGGTKGRSFNYGPPSGCQNAPEQGRSGVFCTLLQT